MKKGATLTSTKAAKLYPLALEIFRNFGALREAFGL